jgi:hypothetical protein
LAEQTPATHFAPPAQPHVPPQPSDWPHAPSVGQSGLQHLPAASVWPGAQSHVLPQPSGWPARLPSAQDDLDREVVATHRAGRARARDIGGRVSRETDGARVVRERRLEVERRCAAISRELGADVGRPHAVHGRLAAQPLDGPQRTRGQLEVAAELRHARPIQADGKGDAPARALGRAGTHIADDVWVCRAAREARKHDRRRERHPNKPLTATSFHVAPADHYIHCRMFDEDCGRPHPTGWQSGANDGSLSWVSRGTIPAARSPNTRIHMRRKIGFGAVFTIAALAAGCNGTSGGGTPTGAGGKGGPLSGTLTWKENGGHSASVPIATRTKSVQDQLRITGDEPSGTTIDFSVSLLAPPLVPGSYPCGVSTSPGRIVSMSYQVGGASSTVATVCTVGITSLDDATSRATGTFSATLPFEDGTTKTLTDGKFDLYVSDRSP